jgi:dolichyl-phosphate beta-glucosyltransferase
MAQPHLSLIIPAYNEAGRIGRTLQAVLAYLRQQPYESELIVVDDGSTDGTAELVHRTAPEVLLVQLPCNRGKGAAVRQGMLAARGRYRVFTDADLSTPIEELARM